MKGFREKCKKPPFLGQMAKFRPNLGQFWPKRAIFEFSQKMRKSLFFRLQRLCFEQKIRKIWCVVVEKKCEKPPFFGPKRPILDSLGKMVKIIKKALGTFFLPFWVLTISKVSEKSNERIWRNFRTNERTNQRGLN